MHCEFVVKDPSRALTIIESGVFLALTSETSKENAGTADQKEAEARAKAFVEAYKTSHPDGPYPRVEIEPKDSSEPASD